ncbi:MAG: SDR family oxidoreductase [Pseudomonadales bacterium]|jgi:meso-butanediol dehydrogenase/(S,S)-butanediol dehydrogenase/diacetyl reductase|nr:SDR family oxidoreductase [Pseudomonadales bacterium]MCP5320333.1 SDR family oxidoreductase [Pseudomonadales bacterium]MCP5337991.1 SDR family oxidoreductase [Pseudomonadales bacterium]
MRRFEGKAAMVTGAGSGIGRATARRLAAEGACVSISDINAAGLAETMALLEGSGHHSQLLDVRQSAACNAAVEAAVAALGKLDILCNVAGIAGLYRLDEVSDEVWERMIGINLSGPFYLSRAAMPHLLRTRGNIVNIASTAALVGQVCNTPYCASKGGLNLLTKALAVEFAKQGVRVNAVCPGGVSTPLTHHVRIPQDVDGELFGRLSSLVQPMGEPEEIAAAVAYLACDEARFVTGESLTIDGGQTVS